MSLTVGDRSPLKIHIPVETEGVDGTLIDSAKCVVTLPNGGTQQWSPAITTKTETLVVATFTLAADGSSLPEHGTYVARTFFYDAGGGLLLYTAETEFLVKESRTRWPSP